MISKIVKHFQMKKPCHNSVLSYKIDLYFPEHKLAIEVDEKGHEDRNIDYEKKKKKKAIEKELRFEFMRINPDDDEYVEIGKLYNYIIKSTKKSTEKI